jgi:arsenate reductase
MKVLFVCTANSCRSQMAEAWARRLFPQHWQVESAGLLTYPITEETRSVMAESGMDMAGQESKTIDRFDLDNFDLIVTLSEQAGRFLPSLLHPDRHIACPLPDPMEASGQADHVRREFRAARDRIRALVERIASCQILAERDGGR